MTLALGGLYAAFVPYLLVVFWRRRLIQGRLGLVIIVAVAARLVVLATPPTLSDDVFRYAWDGRVSRAGLDPYGHAPSAQALAHLRDETVWPHINHPDLRTIYPPVAQLAFAAFGAFGDGVLPMKLLAVVFDLATALVLAFMLGRRGRDPAEVAIYAWHPLVIAETAASGHMDPLAWFLLIGALALLMARSPLVRCLAGAALALSAGAKLLAGAVWPFLARRSRAAALAFPVVLLLVTTPFVLRSGPAMFESLDTYGRKWAGNAGAFVLIEACTDAAAGVVEPVPWRRRQLAGRSARAVVVLLFLGVLGALWLRRASPEEAAFAAVAAFVVLSPVVHPWYVAWVVPFLVLRQDGAWLLLTLLIPLSYLGSPWVTAALVWAPFGLCLGAAALLRPALGEALKTP